MTNCLHVQVNACRQGVVGGRSARLLQTKRWPHHRREHQSEGATVREIDVATPDDDEGELARVEWELLASWLQLSKLLLEGADPLEELGH